MYDIDIFRQVSNNLSSIKIPQKTIEIINNLAHLVGAPSYVKTPNFKPRGYRPKNKTDWALIRNFKVTTIEKKIEGVEKDMDILREFLNKLTEKTYDSNLKKIINKINILEKKNLIIISKYIFDIASSNKFYSTIYAKLYKDLIEKFDEMRDLCIKNFNSFMVLFENIEYIDSEKDYDKFCKINEQNEKRRAMCQFFINLVKNKVIKDEKMTQLIILLQKKMFKTLTEENKKKEAEEIAENLYILLYKNSSLFGGGEYWTEILNNVQKIPKLKTNDYPSLSNKIKFKHLDIIEC